MQHIKKTLSCLIFSSFILLGCGVSEKPKETTTNQQENKPKNQDNLVQTSPNQSHTSQTVMLGFVQQLYQQTKDDPDQSSDELIQKYADTALQQAFKFQEENECMVGYDVIWQSQDPEYDRPLKFNAIAENQIKVDLGTGQWHDEQFVIYTLNCQNQQCKIMDITDTEGSYRENMINYCKEEIKERE